jgi:tRNA 2-thiouridine synthesizing protein E
MKNPIILQTQWTPEMAEEIAREVGIAPLTERHWKVITCCREDAAREGRSPGLRRIAELSGVDSKELYRLFPENPGNLVARIAGLPNPTRRPAGAQVPFIRSGKRGSR